MSSSTQSDQRYDDLMRWASRVSSYVAQLTGFTPPATPMHTTDASQRRFFRAQTHQGSAVLIDSPPASENNTGFAELSLWYRAQGFHVPEIYAVSLQSGFFAVSDLGEQTYLQALQQQPGRAEVLYQDAVDVLVKLAAAPTDVMAPYSRQRFYDELAIFKTHCVEAWLGLSIPPSWRLLCDALVAVTMAQPMVCVHRDFHSRNLMVTPTDSPGLVDYQDSLCGPLTYDIASLLWDCYIDWPEPFCARHLAAFYHQMHHFTLGSFEDFQQACRLTVSQRHLKAVGIFARLHLQQGRSGYLPVIPRVLGYLDRHLRQVHQDFANWLTETLAPEVQRRLTETAI